MPEQSPFAQSDDVVNPTPEQVAEHKRREQQSEEAEAKKRRAREATAPTDAPKPPHKSR